nr:GDSL esterase/lipase CPRD49-like [Quercus suber]
MVGPTRPQFVLFGSSIVQLSFSHGGWGAILSDIYARKADILLRGYFGWNSRRALQVLNQVFPKVLYFYAQDAEGSKIVVEDILKVIKEADWEPCLHWKSMPTEFAEDSPYDLAAVDGKTLSLKNSKILVWQHNPVI